MINQLLEWMTRQLITWPIRPASHIREHVCHININNQIDRSLSIYTVSIHRHDAVSMGIKLLHCCRYRLLSLLRYSTCKITGANQFPSIGLRCIFENLIPKWIAAPGAPWDDQNHEWNRNSTRQQSNTLVWDVRL